MKRIKTAFRQAVKDKLIFGSTFAEVVAGDQSNDERKYFVTRDIITKVIETCRVFEIDMTTCPQCGGPLTLIAAIEDPAVIAKILTHLGWPTRAPPRAPARLDGFLQTA